MLEHRIVHPRNPQPRAIDRAVEVLHAGGLIVYPTDSCYALGCKIGDKEPIERIRRIRALDAGHHFTLLCRNLSQIAEFARVDNKQYRLLKSVTPGSYTFLLEATRKLPRRLHHPKRNTVGIRIPDNVVAQALLASLGEPLLSSTLIFGGDELPLIEPDEIEQRLNDRVDLFLDAGACGHEMTTVIDLTGAQPELVRRGKGSLAALGME
jgi:tRNA threonylcarbamoyl adenosine modification protein (Sua5/YciO/YrdC/YwlC family)